MNGIRRAVVVGINEYQDNKIENLAGAVHDAEEVCELLTSHGKFLVEKGHFLINADATSDNIRAAISDLFWKTEECDTVLFFFSGHGKKDHLKHGYLLPHDANYTAPFVKGIRIQELKQLFLSSQRKNVGLMILDCCYSGIATQAEKGDPEDADYAKSFQEELRLENASIGTGKGRFIWASADAEKTAREEERKHALTGEMHVHGLFSFHLIEGLRGGPQDAYGRISLRRLEDYLSKAFKDDTKHKPQFHSSSASDINDIFLTTAEEKLKEALNERISEISRYIKGNQPTEVFLAIGIINELEREGLACDELIECCNAINKLLQESHPTAFFWWQKNSETILEQARGISEWYKIFNKVIASFDLATVRQLDWQQRKYVAEVLEVIQSTGEAQEVAKLISIRDLNQRALSGGIPKSSQGQDIRALPPSISTN